MTPRSFALPILFTVVFSLSAAADVTLPSVLGNGMVMQRRQPLKFWGWAEAGEEVRVSLDGDQASAVTGADGRWQVDLKAREAGGPLKVVIQGKNRIELTDVLIGEVWVGSGQSNMQWSINASNDPDLESLSAHHPQLRLFNVPRVTAEAPARDVKAAWTPATPDTVKDFSAVAYFFARQLHLTLGVPVGMIHTSWGGTPAEAWTRREAMEAEPSLAPLLKRWDDQVSQYDPQKEQEKFDAALAKWREAVKQAEAEGKRAPDRPRSPADPRTSQNRPANLYNGMIAPLIPFGIKGAIWYQGESNAGRAYQYRTLFPLMIRNWRSDWKQGDFSFYWVQLANFQAVQPEPGESQWAELREAQSMTLALPNTGEAVIIDIGQANDIHPTNKQDVAKRLARWALAKDYGLNLPYSGPRYQSMTVKDRAIELTFDHVANGLMPYDKQPLKGFAIAGEDRKWHWAEAKVEGKNRVVVSSPQVPAPVAVRYGWATHPVCNLYNSARLPASPFRTDDWPLTTLNNH